MDNIEENYSYENIPEFLKYFKTYKLVFYVANSSRWRNFEFDN